jgi:hypothetical protein
MNFCNILFCVFETLIGPNNLICSKAFFEVSYDIFLWWRCWNPSLGTTAADRLWFLNAFSIFEGHVHPQPEDSDSTMVTTWELFQNMCRLWGLLKVKFYKTWGDHFSPFPILWRWVYFLVLVTVEVRSTYNSLKECILTSLKNGLCHSL